MTKELIIRVFSDENDKLFCGIIELIGGKVVDKTYDVIEHYCDIHAELTRDQSLVILESLNGRGKLLAPNKTQA